MLQPSWPVTVPSSSVTADSGGGRSLSHVLATPGAFSGCLPPSEALPRSARIRKASGVHHGASPTGRCLDTPVPGAAPGVRDGRTAAYFARAPWRRWKGHGPAPVPQLTGPGQPQALDGKEVLGLESVSSSARRVSPFSAWSCRGTSPVAPAETWLHVASVTGTHAPFVACSALHATNRASGGPAVVRSGRFACRCPLGCRARAELSFLIQVPRPFLSRFFQLF